MTDLELFHIIDEGQAIICARGVYRQVKVYRRGEDVYAGHGSGFIKLYGGGGTSAPKVSWLGLEAKDVTFEYNRTPKYKGEKK